MVKIAVIVGEFHKEIAEGLIASAKKAAQECKITIAQVFWVSGSYEVPLILKKVLECGKYDGVVILGYIEKGDTLHGEEMGSTVSLLIKQMELMYGIPIGMGIIGPGATAEQAKKRIHYGGRAVVAVDKSLKLLKSFKDRLI